ncbi:response regulator [Wenzhouxiangella sp. XN24]|uniref:response regulator transcription factor n=1 Tax=Wenzhouxiangella sp. XN24 TaxID=2713569 RepID=UPI0013EC82F6|nr:response regulator [Wenzhouxiangella sp. XN24]NGX17583.1 response regulator [Wenzhouxiangella sp. XN24]
MAPVPESSAEAHQATICVVEGDARERDALVQLLSHLQHDVDAFDSAEALLAAIDEKQAQVLVTGLELPGMNGIELLRELRKQGRQVPTIVLAGESDVATAVDAIRAGAMDFIQKPVIERIVLRRVRDALAQPVA